MPYDSVEKKLPKGWKRSFMKRMPDSRLNLQDIMQRVTTILIKNMEEKFRDAPMKTADLMKEIGLRGRQIKEKEEINNALYLLNAQKIVQKVKQNPIRWEIHEEYRKYGVPPISWDKRAPWKMVHLLQFERTKVPKYGPTHGLYRPEDRQFLIDNDLPLSSIYDPIFKPDPFVTGDFALRPKRLPREPKLSTRLPQPPKDADGNVVQHDWDRRAVQAGFEGGLQKPFVPKGDLPPKMYKVRDGKLKPVRGGGM